MNRSPECRLTIIRLLWRLQAWNLPYKKKSGVFLIEDRLGRNADDLAIEDPLNLPRRPSRYALLAKTCICWHDTGWRTEYWKMCVLEAPLGWFHFHPTVPPKAIHRCVPVPLTDCNPELQWDHWHSGATYLSFTFLYSEEALTHWIHISSTQASLDAVAPQRIHGCNLYSCNVDNTSAIIVIMKATGSGTIKPQSYRSYITLRESVKWKPMSQ